MFSGLPEFAHRPLLLLIPSKLKCYIGNLQQSSIFIFVAGIQHIPGDRGSTCKFRNARSAFRNLHVDPLSLHTFSLRALRNLHVDPLSLHTSTRNKQVEFNPYIYTLKKLFKVRNFFKVRCYNASYQYALLLLTTILMKGHVLCIIYFY